MAVKLQIMAIKMPPGLSCIFHISTGRHNTDERYSCPDQKGQIISKILKLNLQFNLQRNGRIVFGLKANIIYNTELMYF